MLVYKEMITQTKIKFSVFESNSLFVFGHFFYWKTISANEKNVALFEQRLRFKIALQSWLTQMYLVLKN